MRTKEYIVPISVHELTKKDRDWLDKAHIKEYLDSSVSDTLDAAATGFCQLWRAGDFEGIFVSEVNQRGKGGLLLWISHMAGRGLLKNFDTIERFFMNYAKDQEYNAVRIVSMKKSLNRIYSRRWNKIAETYERTL